MSVAVALIWRDPAAHELAGGLRAAGHRVRVLDPRPSRTADRVLRARGFTTPLSHLPRVTAALAAGRFDVAHAFSVPDASAALAWRRVTGRPVVFTCTEVLARESVADRRQRLAMLRRAVQDCDAVVASADDVRAAMARWLAVDADLLEPGDVGGHDRLYGRLAGVGR